jgi:hypothetical protein
MMSDLNNCNGTLPTAITDNYGLLSQILCQKALHSFSLENIFCACVIIISPVGFAHSNLPWLPPDYVPKFLPLPLAFGPKW